MKNKRRIKLISMKSLIKLVSVIVLMSLLLDFSVIFGNADTYCTLRINYVFADGTPAHDPYLATYQASEDSLDLEVKNPQITGYDPMTSTDESGLSAETSTIHLEHIDHNVELTVYYIAGLSTYRVMYYKQNIFDDLYTRDNTISSEYTNRRGKTGTNPTVLENEELPGYEGFTNLFHEPDSIAADGSTVFRVYYDRNYYHVLFDLGSGGYGVEPVYAKYQSVYHISEPKRSGYTFLGWALTDKDSTQSNDWHYIDANGNEITEAQALANPILLAGDQTVPADNTYYKALWKKGTTGYSVVYWLENPNSGLSDDYFDNLDYSQMTPEQLSETVSPYYSVAVAYDVKNVESGTEVRMDTNITNAEGTSFPLSDFFGFNFNKQNATSGGYPVDKSGKKIDFTTMSEAKREELAPEYQRYYEINQPITNFQFRNGPVTVAGDGTTRINIFYKRKTFHMQFFYAKTTGGTVTYDADNVPQWNKGSNGKVYLTNGTKQFSKITTKTTLYDRLTESSLFSPSVTDVVPQIVNHTDLISPDFLDDGNGGSTRIWYYEVEAKFGDSLIGKWFNDAFDTPLRKDAGDDNSQVVFFGSWAVEKESDYIDFEDDKTDRGNYTIKGLFEKLYDEILLKESKIQEKLNTDPDFDYTELHFVASWDNTGSLTGSNWNDGRKRVFNFTYKNCVELLPSEDYIASTPNGVNVLINGGTYPEGNHDELNENGETETVHYLSRTIEGRYTDIIEMDVGGGVVKRFGVTEANTVETYDAGAVYTSGDGSTLKDAKTIGQQVRTNQTAAALTGFTAYADSDSTIKTTFTVKSSVNNEITEQTVTSNYGTGSTSNYGNGNKQAVFYAANGFDDVHHADIYFFYTRNNYTLKYRNANQLNDSRIYRAYYNAPLFLQKFQYTPEYPNPDLASYYNFMGWYYDPFYLKPVDFSGDRMPDYDVTLYAKWVPKIIKVSFYPTYNDYYEDANRIGDEITVDYGTYVPHELIPANVEGEERPHLNPPATGAMFAGWYYLRDNIPVRFEPENLPVTALNRESSGEHATFHLYAEWVTKEVGKYEIKYVEKNNHDNEVAEPTIGRAFVWKTRTFNAKGGAQLNDGHAWQEEGRNWWPVVNSHSLVIRANDHAASDYSPNEYTFEYIQKAGVWYRVQYLDATTHSPLAESVEAYTTFASIKADSLFIPGYVAEDMSKSLVLSASELTGDAAKAEELENNVINFYYNQNDSDYLYEVEYYGQNVDDNGYELIQNENIEVAIADDPDTPEVEPTTVLLSEIYNRQYAQIFDSNGFTRVPGATQQIVANSDGTSVTTALSDNGSFTVTSDQRTTIRVYFDRRSYPYTYRYVDYHAERKYLDTDEAERDGMWNGVMETHYSTSNERVEKEVTIPAPTDLTYDSKPYIRVSENDIVLMIAPDESNPDVNVINVYYRKFDERELQYKLVCKASPYNDLDYDITKNPPQPLFGGLSMTGQTVDAYSEIQSVNFYDFNNALDPMADESLPETERYLYNHRYTFLGWFDNPEGTGTPLSADAVLTPAEMVNNTEELPDHNTTFYAVVEQDMVHANFEFRTVEQALPMGGDSGETEEDRQAAVIVGAAPMDSDGSKTGDAFNFSDPNNYTSGAPTPWERSFGYNLTVDPIDDRVYKYEFAEWWEEDLTPGENYGKLIRKKNWNSDGEWSPTVLQQVLDRQSDKHVIAVYTRREVAELPYTINYTFVDRFGETKTFVKTGTLTADELNENSPNAKVTADGDFRLTDEFIIANSPYESNYGQTLRWSDRQIEKTSVKGNEAEGTVDRIVTNVTAVQSTKRVFANYKLTPDELYNSHIINSFYGANYKLDEQMLDMKAPAAYNGMAFSYWAVRKSPLDSAPVVAKSYDTLFDLCLMDNYYISPVYEGAAPGSGSKTAVLGMADGIAQGNEDWLAWTWNEGEDGEWVRPDGSMTFNGLKAKVKFVRVPSGTAVTDGVWDETFEESVWNYSLDLDVQDGRTFTLINYYQDGSKKMYGEWSESPEQAPAEPAADEPEVILTHLDYSRNRWTDENGNISNTGETDLLFTDFEIAFEDNREQIYGENSEYRAGVVFELCGTLSATATFNPERDYGYYSDPDKLKAAVLNRAASYTTQNKEGAAATKTRKIQCSEIDTANMTNRNRIEFSQYYKNAYSVTDNGDGTTTVKYTNSNYLLKATAYLIKGDTVTLSNSVYICLKSEAAKDLAIGYNIWDTVTTTP